MHPPGSFRAGMVPPGWPNWGKGTESWHSCTGKLGLCRERQYCRQSGVSPYWVTLPVAQLNEYFSLEGAIWEELNHMITPCMGYFFENLPSAENWVLHLGYQSEQCSPPAPVLALTEVSLAGETDNQGLYLLSDMNKVTRHYYRSS